MEMPRMTKGAWTKHLEKVAKIDIYITAKKFELCRANFVLQSPMVQDLSWFRHKIHDHFLRSGIRTAVS